MTSKTRPTSSKNELMQSLHPNQVKTASKVVSLVVKVVSPEGLIRAGGVHEIRPTRSSYPALSRDPQRHASGVQHRGFCRGPFITISSIIIRISMEFLPMLSHFLLRDGHAPARGGSAAKGKTFNPRTSPAPESLATAQSGRLGGRHPAQWPMEGPSGAFGPSMNFPTTERTQSITYKSARPIGMVTRAGTHLVVQ